MQTSRTLRCLRHAKIADVAQSGHVCATQIVCVPASETVHQFSMGTLALAVTFVALDFAVPDVNNPARADSNIVLVCH